MVEEHYLEELRDEFTQIVERLRGFPLKEQGEMFLYAHQYWEEEYLRMNERLLDEEV